MCRHVQTHVNMCKHVETAQMHLQHVHRDIFYEIVLLQSAPQVYSTMSQSVHAAIKKECKYQHSKTYNTNQLQGNDSNAQTHKRLFISNWLNGPASAQVKITATMRPHHGHSALCWEKYSNLISLQAFESWKWYILSAVKLSSCFTTLCKTLAFLVLDSVVKKRIGLNKGSLRLPFCNSFLNLSPAFKVWSVLWI